MPILIYVYVSTKRTSLFSYISQYVGNQMLDFISTVQISRASFHMLVTLPHSLTQYFAVFSALRVYALWYTSRFKYLFFAFVFILGCIPIAIRIVSSCIEDNRCHLMLEYT